MNTIITLTDETIASSIETSWTVMHQFIEEENWQMVIHMMSSIRDHLDGMWAMLLYCGNSSKAVTEAQETIRFLNQLTRNIDF